VPQETPLQVTFPKCLKQFAPVNFPTIFYEPCMPETDNLQPCIYNQQQLTDHDLINLE